MKLCRCVALVDTIADGKFFSKGTAFVTSLGEAIRLAGSVQRTEVYDEPEPPPPPPPRAGTFEGADEPPNHRMIKQAQRRALNMKVRGDGIEE